MKCRLRVLCWLYIILSIAQVGTASGEGIVSSDFTSARSSRLYYYATADNQTFYIEINRNSGFGIFYKSWSELYRFSTEDLSLEKIMRAPEGSTGISILDEAAYFGLTESQWMNLPHYSGPIHWYCVPLKDLSKKDKNPYLTHTNENEYDRKSYYAAKGKLF